MASSNREDADDGPGTPYLPRFTSRHGPTAFSDRIQYTAERSEPGDQNSPIGRDSGYRPVLAHASIPGCSWSGQDVPNYRHCRVQATHSTPGRARTSIFVAFRKTRAKGLASW